MSATTGAKTPWHFWAVGVFGVLWSAMPCYDYFMTQTKGAAYLQSAGMSEALTQHFSTLPAWMVADWAIGVWGGLLGAILLLVKSRWAVPVFVVSLISFVVSVIYMMIIRPVPGGVSSSILIFDGVIFGVCVFFVWYSMRAKKQGLLR